MLWLKRNLAVVIAISVVVVLTGLGGVYTWTKKGLNDELSGKLEAQKAELERLLRYGITPKTENVQRMETDLKEAQKYSEQCRKLFAPTAVPTLNNQSYRSMLETRVGELRRAATNAGVDVPPNYSFSFEPEIKPIMFDAVSLKHLPQQLVEVSDICQALFTSRVHRLGGLKRVGVCQYDLGAVDVFADLTVVSNKATGLLVWPYEISFDCFSGDLAAVMEALSRIPRMLVAKTLRVEAVGAGPMGLPLEMMAPPPGGGSPPGPVRPGVKGAPPRPKVLIPGLVTVLDDRMLRVEMQLHVVKPEK